MKKSIFTTCTVLFLSLIVFAQPGSLDMSFDPGQGASHSVTATAVQSDGKIIIGGFFTTYDGTPINRIVRLHTDGSLDTSFNPGSGANDFVDAISVQDDGKILIGGTFNMFNGTPRGGIARLNTDGSLDTSFNPGTGALGQTTNPAVRTIAIQSDGKIFIGGDFVTYNGTSRMGVARLNSDGSLDTSFAPGTGTNYTYVKTIAIQNDGKIIIVGNFIEYNGITRRGVARINTDGSLDTSFNPGTGVGINNGNALAVAIQSDGKIIVGGDFVEFNGQPYNSIVRLNSNGTFDASFNTGSGFVGYLFDIQIQADGKIIVGGHFSTYNGTTAHDLVRLNTNGALDTNFSSGLGLTNFSWPQIHRMTIQNDGKIIIGGYFEEYDGVSRNYIARINASDCSITDITVDDISDCDSQTNTYSVELTITYHTPPPVGMLNVNGVDFPISGSPQNVMLSNLPANAENVVVDVYFTAETACANTVSWTAPESCDTAGVTDIAQSVTRIYPNPANSILNIEVNENTHIKIVNMLGATLITQKLNTGNNAVDVSGFANGVYFIHNDKGSTVKFVKR